MAGSKDLHAGCHSAKQRLDHLYPFCIVDWHTKRSFLKVKCVIAAEHTILDVIGIPQSSLDPVFCAELCIVEISICFCPSVRMLIPGEFCNLQVNLENEGCVRTIFCAARACFCSSISMCSSFYTIASFCISAGTISRQIFS